MGDIGNIPPTGKSRLPVISVPYVASWTPDLTITDNDVIFDMLVTGNLAFQNPSLIHDTQEFTARLRDDGAGGHAITFPGSAYRGSDDTPLQSLTTVAGKTYYFAFKVNAASGKLDFVAPNKGFA